MRKSTVFIVAKKLMRIAVVDSNAVFRSGLETILNRAGFHAVPMPSPSEEWTGIDGSLVVLRDEETWACLASNAGSGAVVVALLPAFEIETVRLVLQLGGAGVVACEAPEEVILASLRSGMIGEVLLGREVARALSQPGSTVRASSRLSENELNWLRSFSEGSTVADLSKREFVSEREMYRRLQSIYVNIGASNRSQAMVQAARLGLI